ncbi:MAG: hypothetical protein R2856_37835 [Caldilineaceae bacterium]
MLLTALVAVLSAWQLRPWQSPPPYTRRFGCDRCALVGARTWQIAIRATTPGSPANTW